MTRLRSLNKLINMIIDRSVYRYIGPKRCKELKLGHSNCCYEECHFSLVYRKISLYLREKWPITSLKSDTDNNFLFLEGRVFLFNQGFLLVSNCQYGHSLNVFFVEGAKFITY